MHSKNTTRTIPLSQNCVALVDAADYAKVAPFNWFFSSSGYAVRNTRDGSATLMHRLILDAPDGCDVDHINRDKLDNRRANLRLVSRSHNVMNTDLRCSNTSGYKGVSWSRVSGKWEARIRRDERQIYLGLYPTAEDAARAYDAKARELFGDVAALNFPDDPSEYRHPVREGNTSGYRGVSQCKSSGKWHAYISASRKRTFLGSFETKEDAARAYDEAARELHGDRARLNFPSS